MVIRIQIHIMPWEIDYAQIAFQQLKKSKFYLPEDVHIQISSVLNLTSHKINWKKSSLPKQFFKDKYEDISILLLDYNHISEVYEGDENYGHLDLQRESLSPEVDYYIVMCPDIAFSEHLLSRYCAAVKLIKNEYFVITPQINKMWDSSWDCLVNPLYKDLPYDTGYKCDSFTVMNNQTNNPQELSLIELPVSKFAGWFDLYSKKFYEELVPVKKEWSGYGAWDYYSMLVSNTYRQVGGDFTQFVLQGETIVDWAVGPWGYSLANYYKKHLSIKTTPDYGALFQEQIHNYVIERVSKFNLK